MSDYVTTKDFMQEMKEVREEAKRDRHEFSNIIQCMLTKFDDKLEKVITNNVKIKIIEKEVSEIKEDHKWFKKLIWTAAWAVWTVSWIGTAVAQIYLK